MSLSTTTLKTISEEANFCAPGVKSHDYGSNNSCFNKKSLKHIIQKYNKKHKDDKIELEDSTNPTIMWNKIAEKLKKIKNVKVDQKHAGSIYLFYAIINISKISLNHQNHSRKLNG